MKPQLVDLNDFYKKVKPIHNSQSKPKIIKPKESFNFESLFNMIGLIIILIGFLFLYKKKKEKEKSRKDLEDRIQKLKYVIDSSIT